MSQNIVYKTYEINTDVEHYAKPINLSGASTVKLTDLPAGVKCWISTESTGENKFPLINRGDGWVNLPAPLYDLYIYTEGTTIDNQKIVLNYTGQNDFFVYGNNSSEKIEQIGQIVSLSKQTIKDINDAVYNTSMRNVVYSTTIQGTWQIEQQNLTNYRIAILPLGDKKIADLNLDNNKFYRITQIGHFDVGDSIDSSGGELGNISIRTSVSGHMSLFTNGNSATFSKITPVTTGAGMRTNFPIIYSLDKSPISKNTEEFDLWGLKYFSTSFYSTEGGVTYGVTNTPQPLNFKSNDFIVGGNSINLFENLGVFWKVSCMYGGGVLSKPSSHISLFLEVSEVLSE